MILCRFLCLERAPVKFMTLFRSAVAIGHPGSIRDSPSSWNRSRPAHFLTISAVGTITSVPAGADFNYTIQLTNTSSGGSTIGTFWFASTSVEQNYLATSPISVTAPLGWAYAVTHQGAGDGYGIEFTTSNADFKPGDTLDFSFQTADTPQQIGGNSEFYPGTPAGTSALYPQTPFANGVEFEVTSGIRRRRRRHSLRVGLRWSMSRA